MFVIVLQGFNRSESGQGVGLDVGLTLITLVSTHSDGLCNDNTIIYLQEAYGDADQSASKQTMITLGDPGINRGWNDGLPGTCLNELRKLIVPALVAFTLLPPHLSSNVNITYLIKIVEIEKPKFPSMDKIFQFEEMLISTIVMVTEETLIPGERNDGIDEEDPDINRTDGENERRKTSPPKDQQEVDVAIVVFYLQLAAIPVVILLILIIAYYIYKIKYPHKRTTFFK
ncbi:hypothetical protein BSL78_26234 [Apostichopus japonicus]|uniref:Uncharacterized protein n=1 Tax=Stichopus japonicus TaxID=307972 RepID=A0A2G8JMG7_STIJA|nr:hypothetical protein BSL78_26234 [Apostichopus japonicus]